MDISSDLKQLMIDFALNEDMDYRLKRNEDGLLLYGFSFGLVVRSALVETIEEVFNLKIYSLKRDYAMDHFKDLLVKKQSNIHNKLNKVIKNNIAVNPGFLEKYISIYNSKLLASNLTNTLNVYAFANGYFDFLDVNVRLLSSNEHLENLLNC